MELKHMHQPSFLYRRLLIDNQTSSNDSYSDDSEFDTNMVIILAFLLFAVLVALAVNILARCGLLQIFCTSSTEPKPAPGLKKRALRQLPVVVYGLGPDVSTKECSICLGEFLDGERIRVLPKCSHEFHVGCIDTWLVSHGSCPNCRTSLVEPPPAPPSADRDRPVAVDVSSQLSIC